MSPENHAVTGKSVHTCPAWNICPRILLSGSRPYLAPQQDRPHGAAHSHKVGHMTQGISKTAIIAMLGVIAALTLVMAFTPSGSIYQG